MMKKLLALLLLASMLLLAFVACGGDEKDSESASESQSESQSESDSQIIEKPTTGDEGWTNPAGGK